MSMICLHQVESLPSRTKTSILTSPIFRQFYRPMMIVKVKIAVIQKYSQEIRLLTGRTNFSSAIIAEGHTLRYLVSRRMCACIAASVHFTAWNVIAHSFRNAIWRDIKQMGVLWTIELWAVYSTLLFKSLKVLLILLKNKTIFSIINNFKEF